jgi:hypothetical protein
MRPHPKAKGNAYQRRLMIQRIEGDLPVTLAAETAGWIERTACKWSRRWRERARRASRAAEAGRGRPATVRLADELKRNEPVPAEGHESASVDEDVLGALDPEARSSILEYVHDLARGEAHQTRKEIMRFTRERGAGAAGLGSGSVVVAVEIGKHPAAFVSIH